MKSLRKHRATGTGKTPRTGATALVIGGLVAGTVAAAGATAFKAADAPTVANALTASLDPQTTTAPNTDLADRAAAMANLRSASLDELREQRAGDRSEARSAPEDVEAVGTVLASSTFSGTTPVADEPTADATAVEEVVTEVEGTSGTTSAQTTTRDTSTQEETYSEPAPAPSTEPAPQPQPQPQQPAPAPAPAPAPTPAPIAGGVVGIAQQYVGYPYVLPGNPPSTFDCSSFTWWVFQQAGIDIPRTVSGQKAAVTPVTNPQPGDLVFTTNFYHVGLYAGNGMVIEALNPSTGVTYGAPVYGGVWYGRLNG